MFQQSSPYLWTSSTLPSSISSHHLSYTHISTDSIRMLQDRKIWRTNVLGLIKVEANIYKKIHTCCNFPFFFQKMREDNFFNSNGIFKTCCVLPEEYQPKSQPKFISYLQIMYAYSDIAEIHKILLHQKM